MTDIARQTLHGAIDHRWSSLSRTARNKNITSGPKSFSTLSLRTRQHRSHETSLIFGNCYLCSCWPIGLLKNLSKIDRHLSLRINIYPWYLKGCSTYKLPWCCDSKHDVTLPTICTHRRYRKEKEDRGHSILWTFEYMNMTQYIWCSLDFIISVVVSWFQYFSHIGIWD